MTTSRWFSWTYAFEHELDANWTVNQEMSDVCQAALGSDAWVKSAKAGAEIQDELDMLLDKQIGESDGDEQEDYSKMSEDDVIKFHSDKLEAMDSSYRQGLSGKQVVGELRAKKGDALQVSHEIYSDRKVQVHLCLMCGSSRSLRSEHLTSLKMLSTQHGSLEYFYKNASGELWMETCRKIMATLSDLDLLESLCISMHATPDGSETKLDDIDAPTVEIHVRFVLNLISCHAWNKSYYSSTSPRMLACLADPNRPQAKRLMDRACELYNAFARIEQQLKRQPKHLQSVGRELLMDLSFRMNQDSNEVMHVYHSNGQDIESAELKYWAFVSFARRGSTKPANENVFAWLRASARVQNQNQHLSGWA